jgi:putative ABC transport system permease protein
MAWRDSRRDRRRLLLFSLSIVFGIAALVSIGSLRDNLQDTIDDQAKALLGADLMLTSRRPFDEESEKLIADIGGERVDEISFTTMLVFPKADGGTRLAQMRAFDRGFPFYGDVVTEPADAWEQHYQGKGAVLEKSLMDQFDAKVGDPVRIGTLEVPIVGYLVVTPPRPSAFSAFAPQAYLAKTRVEETGLLSSRSLAFFRKYYQFERGYDVDGMVLNDERKEAMRTAGIRSESAEGRKRNLGRALDNLYSFLSLIGFMALMLGGIGVASAIHVHVLRRVGTVATLRCIGCPVNRAFSIFLAQGIMLGIVGSVAGTTLGVVIQKLAPLLVEKFLPFTISAVISPGAILGSLAIGMLLCISFSLLPLLSVRRIAPLAALRSGVQSGRPWWKDPAAWLVVVVLVGTLLTTGLALSPDKIPFLGAGFVLGVTVVIAILAVIAKLISLLARKALHASMPYTLRQGLANLHRPRNQTLLFMVSIGLGVFLIVTMLSTQQMLIEQIGVGSVKGKSNVFMIDVQPDQLKNVEAVVQQLNMPIQETAPMVSMRLAGIKGKPLSEVQEDKGTRVPGWILRRDFRSTYREGLVDTEELIEGEWIERVTNVDFESAVPVSIEEGVAKDLKVGLGDELEMDVQGLPLKMKITSVRKVDWSSMTLNFFLVFPLGILEDAPGFSVVGTRAPDATASGELQRVIVEQFPNVTVFDVTLILQTIESVIEKIGYVIRFMALFTVLTGIIILIGAILSGKRDRIEESVLLRTLGASRKQIRAIILTEYFFLGLFAALTGALLSMGAGWALAIWVFKVEFLAYAWPVVAAVTVVTALTVAFGMALSRGITSHPPLSILRREV